MSPALAHSSSFPIISKCTVYPETKSTLEPLKLSVSDLPMLSCHYIQKGIMFSLSPTLDREALVTSLKNSLSKVLVHFPPLAGRLNTDSQGCIYISSIDVGVEFLHSKAEKLKIVDVLSPSHVPDPIRNFFTLDYIISYNGHHRPITAVQVTELEDGVFIGCTVNHAIVDGTSLWNFFNTWAEVCRGVSTITRPPKFERNFVKISQAVLDIPEGGPEVTFDVTSPIRERIFHFAKESIQELKARANGRRLSMTKFINAELFGKQINDLLLFQIGKPNPIRNGNILPTDAKISMTSDRAREKDAKTREISSFQSLSALLWRSVTRARNLDETKETTFRMAVNCRHRVEPPVAKYYFGNAIQSIRTIAKAGELLSKDLQWSAGLLHGNVASHVDATVRRNVDDWEKKPHVFPLGNPDGASITMGSSPLFPMYDNDFGWGKPIAIRSGRANKFDGKISAFPGREGGGSVDLEVCLAPETMAALEKDPEFMHYVTPVAYP